MPKKNDPYEFNAPQYLDFTQGIPDDTDDAYFELAPEDPPTATARDEEPKTTTTKSNEPQAKTDMPPAATEEPQDTEKTDSPQKVTQEQASAMQVTQPDTAMQVTQPDTAMQVTQPDTAMEITQPDKAVEVTQPDTAMEVTEPDTEESEEPPTAAEEPEAAGAQSASKAKKNRRRSKSLGVRQSPRLIAISKALRRIAAQRFSPSSLSNSPSTSTRAKGSLVTKVQAQKKGNNRVPGVSSLTEDDKTELDTMTTFQEKISNNKKRKQAHSSTQPLKPTKPHEFHFATDERIRNHPETHAAPDPVMPAPSRPTRSGPTKPQEFKFATDARLKGKEAVKGEEVEAPVEFSRMLRSSSSSSLNKESAGAGNRGPTIPQPFHFSDTRRHQQQHTEEPQKFVSMAELNLKFIVGTPERFRTKRAGSVESQEGSKKPRGVTMPHTPNLATSRRRRSLSVMTQEEREMKEFEEAQKHAFKAKPVNKKVFGAPSTGCHVEKKLPTVPEPFNITDSKKAPPSLSVTLGSEVSDSSFVSSFPYGGLSMKGTRTKTKIKPFSFDERDKNMMINKQQKIQKFLEEEKSLAEFHARPMPVFEDGVHGVPPKKPPTPTQVKPFALRVDHRGSSKQEKFKQQLEKEAQWETEQRRFHAQGDDVVHKMPFVPEKSKKPLTEISNFTLKTEVRADERSQYELQQKAIEEEMQAAKKMEEEQRAAEELAEVARLRQEAVHKAQPVPKYKPLVIKPSSHPLTVPESPNFATKTRLRSQSQAKSNSTFSVDM